MCGIRFSKYMKGPWEQFISVAGLIQNKDNFLILAPCSFVSVWGSWKLSVTYSHLFCCQATNWCRLRRPPRVGWWPWRWPTSSTAMSWGSGWRSWVRTPSAARSTNASTNLGFEQGTKVILDLIDKNISLTVALNQSLVNQILAHK